MVPDVEADKPILYYLRTENPYADALKAAIQELTCISNQQQELTDRAKFLRMAIASLQVLMGERPEAEMLPGLGLDPDAGITDAVRYFLSVNPERRFAPAEILEGLKEIGFKLPGYSNAFSVIANVLQRLISARVVKSSRTPQGHKLVYQWVGVESPGEFGRTKRE